MRPAGRTPSRMERETLSLAWSHTRACSRTPLTSPSDDKDWSLGHKEDKEKEGKEVGEQETASAHSLNVKHQGKEYETVANTYSLKVEC